MGALDSRRQARLKRKKRIRKTMTGTPARPRMSVFRSKKHIYAQVIDDLSGMTIAAASSLDQTIRDLPREKGKITVAVSVGRLVAERATDKGVKQVVFDRNGFLYHGRVKAVSEGARKAGLDF